MKKWFIRILKSRIVSESITFRGQIRSRSLRFNFCCRDPDTSAGGILPFFVEPGSRAKSGPTCQVLRPRRAEQALALSRLSMLPSATLTAPAP
jgi:hypothetical protein